MRDHGRRRRTRVSGDLPAPERAHSKGGDRTSAKASRAVTRASLEATRARRETAEADRQIVRAALACFGRFGVRKSTLEDIAREAGVSRATIYRYFQNKDTLLRIVISQEVARILSEVQKELKGTYPIDVKLARSFRVLEDELADHKVLHSVIELEPELILPQITVEGRASLAMLTSLLLPALRKAARAHEISPDALDDKCEWIARSVVGELARVGLKRRFGNFDDALAWTRSRLVPCLGVSSGKPGQPPAQTVAAAEEQVARHAAPADGRLGKRASGRADPIGGHYVADAVEACRRLLANQGSSDSLAQAYFRQLEEQQTQEQTSTGLAAAGGQGSRVGPSAPGDEDLRERIATAALRCFARKGVSRTSIEDVARAAGCARATVYRRFSSKGEIVGEAIRLEARRFFDALASRLEGASSFEEVFVVCAVTADEFIGGHQVLQVIVEAEPDLLLPHVALDAPLVVKVSRDFLQPYVQKLMDEGNIDVGDSAEIAEWLVRCILGLLLVPSFRFDTGSVDSMYRLASRFIAPCLRQFVVGAAT